MKLLQKSLIVIMIICSSTAISQTYEIRRTDNQRRGINYGNTIPTTDLAGYIGGVQSQMQSKYENNYLRVEDKVKDIARIVARLTNSGSISTYQRREYLTGYTESLQKINKINFSDTVTVNKVLNYMREVEDELNSW
jgi:NADPH-dependent curcumin reductase CurA